MNLTTASRTFQLLTRILDTQSATAAFHGGGEAAAAPAGAAPALPTGHAGEPGRLLSASAPVPGGAEPGPGPVYAGCDGAAQRPGDLRGRLRQPGPARGQVHLLRL